MTTMIKHILLVVLFGLGTLTQAAEPQKSPAVLLQEALYQEVTEGNLDKAKFTITAGARLNQTAGSVGSRITIEGSGFAV